MEDFQLTLQRLHNVEQENIILREIIEKFEEKNNINFDSLVICRMDVVPKNIQELNFDNFFLFFKRLFFKSFIILYNN